MRRNRLNVLVHFVWATWDRLPLIKEEIERRLYRYISTVCEDDQCEVVAIGGTDNHLHLLVSLPSTITMAELIKNVKGGSSRFITETLIPGEWFAWQENYGAFSVSPQDKSRVIAYIRNQKQHHAENTLWKEAERTFEEVIKPE